MRAGLLFPLSEAEDVPALQNELNLQNWLQKPINRFQMRLKL